MLGGALCSVVAGLSVVGVLREAPDSVAPSAATRLVDEPGSEVLARARAACRPAFDTGIDDEPWRGERRQRSERTFQARIAKEHEAYVNGRNGWKFFSDIQHENFSQAVGRVTLSARERRAWARWIRKSERIVEQAGGRYFVVVAPAKWEVYPHKLPRWAQRLRGTTSLQSMLREYPDLPWIDTRSRLREAGKRHHTYQALNSHWTEYGAHVAWQAIMRCVRASARPGDPSYDGVGPPAMTGVARKFGYNEFAVYGVPDRRPGETYPIYTSDHPATTVTHLPSGTPIPNRPDHITDLTKGPLRTQTPDAQAPGLTLMTLHDSMGSLLSPLWSTSFGTTIQHGHGINQMGFTPPDLAGAVAAYRPDLVLFVITERWLYARPRGVN